MVALAGLVLGAVLAAAGVASVKYAYRIARFEEQIDAIGSKRDLGTVEPADWKVALNKVLGVALGGLGVIAVLLSLFD
jgi:hypothetical protein